MPTKSGLVGLLAAAKGLRRQDPLEELLDLRLAVRSDQPGKLLRDFQTAQHPVSRRAMPLSYRFYWADAVFTAFISGRDEVMEGLKEALENPAFPIYLGRRSCVPEGRIVLDLTTSPIVEVIRRTPWQASVRHQRRRTHQTVTVDVEADVGVFEGLLPNRQLQDVPVSFDPERREYATREVVSTTVEVENPSWSTPAEDDHDPLALAGDYS